MQKIKFTIKGMHCQSCAALIEEKLKNQDGVATVRVSFDSKKGVIFYHEAKISESRIFGLIKEAGNFTVEKIEFDKTNPVEKKSHRAGTVVEDGGGLLTSPNVQFYLGLLVSITILALIGDVILGLAVYKRYNPSPGLVKGAQELGLGNIPQPSAPQGAGQPVAIQEFKITKQDNIRGDFNAPITLVEFSDFECPFCAKSYPTFKRLLSDYRGKIRLVYKHFPLSFHPNSQKAAEAAQCAAEQGQFWEYHDKLFENQSGGFSVGNFKAWADDLGLNAEKFNDCLDTDKYADRVVADLNEGQQKGVLGTPATFINGQLVSGALPYESFSQIIDGLLKNQ